jgi:dihydroorotate dehydrogenase (NAD+) catalytic subunit
MGGIETGADALAFAAAGATAVAVGTASFRDPLAALRIRSELEAELDRRGLMTLGEVRGKMLGQSRVVDLK